MALTAAYLVLLALVGLNRLIELRISHRNQVQLEKLGARSLAEPHFRWLVALHSGALACAGGEVLALGRPLIPALAVPMGILFVLANLLRWWVIRTLAGRWNMQVMFPLSSGVVTSGPYRWVRHPNYVAVMAELFALPMIHTAWITALAGTLVYAGVMWRRLRLEEGVLLCDPAYRAAMGPKPRFLPGLF